MARKPYRKVRRTAYFPPDARGEGVDITFDYRSRGVTVGGWYDSFVDISSTWVPLWEFLERLDIRDADIAASRLEKPDALSTTAEL